MKKPFLFVFLLLPSLLSAPLSIFSSNFSIYSRSIINSSFNYYGQIVDSCNVPKIYKEPLFLQNRTFEIRNEGATEFNISLLQVSINGKTQKIERKSFFRTLPNENSDQRNLNEKNEERINNDDDGKFDENYSKLNKFFLKKEIESGKYEEKPNVTKMTKYLLQRNEKEYDGEITNFVNEENQLQKKNYFLPANMSESIFLDYRCQDNKENYLFIEFIVGNEKENIKFEYFKICEEKAFIPFDTNYFILVGLSIFIIFFSAKNQEMLSSQRKSNLGITYRVLFSFLLICLIFLLLLIFIEKWTIYFFFYTCIILSISACTFVFKEIIIASKFQKTCDNTIKIFKFEFYLTTLICFISSLGLSISWAITKNYVINDILAFGFIFASFKLVKLSTLKKGTIFIFTLAIIDLLFTFVIQKFLFKNKLFGESFCLPINIEIPTSEIFLSKRCSWINIGNIIFPGLFLSYYHRFDASKKIRIYFLTGFLGYLLGNGFWLLSSFSLDFASPLLFFLCILLVLLPILLSFLRNEHFELWNGNFYDSERNFANLKQGDSSLFFEVGKKNADIENSNNKNNRVLKDSECLDENSVNTRRKVDEKRSITDENNGIIKIKEKKDLDLYEENIDKNKIISDKNKKNKTNKNPEKKLNEKNKNLWEGLMDSEEEGKDGGCGGRVLFEMRGRTRNFEREDL